MHLQNLESYPKECSLADHNGATDSIAEIAWARGCYDQGHFSHSLKLHTGFTPAEFSADSSGAVLSR